MPRTIDYYFSLHSPWTYLGHATFLDIAARHGCRIVYRPVPLRAVFDETGGLPLPKVPVLIGSNFDEVLAFFLQ